MQIDLNETVAYRDIGNGIYLCVDRWSATGGKLAIGLTRFFGSYFDVWIYHSIDEAIEVCMSYELSAVEPQGWYRHPATGRRVAQGGEYDPEGHRTRAKGEIYIQW